MLTNPNLTSIAATVEFLRQQAQQSTQTVASETIALAQADNRVLAADISAGINVPSYDNSAMDGYAIRVEDLSSCGNKLPISQRITAGSAALALQPGTAARIFTGAMIPAGANCVVMQENTTKVTENGQDLVVINSAVKLNDAIRRCGEDISKGSRLLTKGKKLTPADLGLIASVGQAEVEVFKRLKVALFSTGNELVTPGSIAAAQLPPGAIYNSNQSMLQAMLQRLGCDILLQGTIADDAEQCRHSFIQAAQQCDLIITSGGVSVGEEDHVKQVVQQLGTLNLWRVAIRPGKPFAYGQLAPEYNKVHFIGLPGNPVSSFITFLILLRPFILALQGNSQIEPPRYRLVAASQLSKADKKRTEYLRARLTPAAEVELFAQQGSGVLSSVSWADGLLENPAGQLIQPGDLVNYIALKDLLS